MSDNSTPVSINDYLGGPGAADLAAEQILAAIPAELRQMVKRYGDKRAAAELNAAAEGLMHDREQAWVQARAAELDNQ
jgi:hypothetical protein